MKPLIHRILKPVIVLFFCALTLPGRAQDTLFVQPQNIDSLLLEMQKTQGVVYIKSKHATGPALRTNVLWWGVGAPNLGFELPLDAHWTVGVDGGFQAWDRFFWNDGTTAPRRWRHFAVTPDVRWYPRAVGDGFLLDVNFLYAHYNIGNVQMPFGLYPSLAVDYRQGNLFGGGISAGYAWPLGAHWRLEAALGAAAAWYSQENYYIGSRCRHCRIGPETGWQFIPKLELGVVYSFETKSNNQ